MKSDCIYYIPANYAVCATCQIGGYCHRVCERFIHKNAPCVKQTLNECRISRDQWLESNNLKKKNDEN